MFFFFAANSKRKHSAVTGFTFVSSLALWDWHLTMMYDGMLWGWQLGFLTWQFPPLISFGAQHYLDIRSNNGRQWSTSAGRLRPAALLASFCSADGTESSILAAGHWSAVLIRMGSGARGRKGLLDLIGAIV